MKHVPLAVALVLLASPLAAAAEEAPARDPTALPSDYAPVARAWVEAARADLALEDAEWVPEVARILDGADERASAGRAWSAAQEVARARVAMAFYPFWAEVERIDGETGRRGLVTTQTEAWYAEASREQDRARVRLVELEDRVTSLLALEGALLAADVLVDAHYEQSVYATFKQEIDSGQLDAGLVFGLTSVTVGAAWKYRLAADLLGPAEAREGLEPRFVASRFADLVNVSRTPSGGFVPPPSRPYDELIGTTGERDEDVLAVAAFLAIVRSERVTGVQAQFGDAATRGIDATRDLAENLNRSLDQPALRLYEDLALEGLAVRAAADQAAYVFENAQYAIAYLARAWIGVEHARTLTTLFDDLSPVRNATRANGDPVDAGPPAGLVLVGGGALVAVVAGVVWWTRRRG